MLLTVFAGSTWALQQATFINPVVELTGQVNTDQTYTQKIHWYDDESYGWIYDGNLPDWAYAEFDYSYVVLSGDLTVSFLGSHDENQNYLDGVKVVFKGTQGSIQITAKNNVEHNGQYFECSYILYFNMHRKVWDFTSEQYGTTPGRSWIWNNENGPVTRFFDPSSETRTYHQYQFPVNEWTEANYFFTVPEGLKFSAPQYKFGYNNPENGDGSERFNRYVVFGQGSKIAISKEELQKCNNPRIRIKMARAGSKQNLTITNGRDALDNNISNAYIIGGSQWRGDLEPKDKNFRGEYHFSPQSKDADFVITCNSEYLLLLYVELYDSPEVISENEILAVENDGYQFLNNGGYNNDNYGQNGVSNSYKLHYYGEGERASLEYNTVTTTGTVTYDQNRLFRVDNFQTKYISKVGEFGTIRMRLNCYSFDYENSNNDNNADNSHRYCTDFAWRTMSVGYMQNKQYPYTWDFTDVKTYSATGLEKEQYYAGGKDNQGNTTYLRNHWDGFGHRIAVDNGKNILFCQGSQLWYGQNIIPETQGLGFYPTNCDAAYNGALTMTEDGLTISQDQRSWWLYRIIVPKVSKDDVIYVRAHKLPQITIDNPLYGKEGEPETVDVPFYNAGYYYGYAPYNGFSITPFAIEVEATDGTGDVIYVLPGKNQNNSEDITLFFSGVTIKKIAVSEDPKTVNIKGWASESRGRVIDPELTGYMTGSNLQTFIVDQQNYGDNVVITRIDNKALVMDAVPSVNGSYTDNNAACLIYNNDPNYEDIEEPDVTKIESNKVEIINGGFHLFVPDMHDYGTSDAKKKLVSTVYPNNQLKSAIIKDSDVPASADGKTNYALSYRAYHETTNEPIVGKEGFYRIQNDGIKSNGNQAYLPIANSSSILMYNLAFDGDGADTNAIDNRLINSHHSENNVYYNMNGQKIKGIPTTRGLYIVNGKKVIIK